MKTKGKKLSDVSSPRVGHFWGLRFNDGSVPDGGYARGETREQAEKFALERWGDAVDLSSLEIWGGVL